jgi:hypothetical protein
VAKRSPILGYNHNVRYRGLIFHVQTEDSGVLSPHLFTHLFHAGVIVSTRKLVYDAGSDEGAIKSLMQAQHKAVMKDLKRGTFDDKIDQYLGETEGLLPRGVGVVDESQPGDPLRDSQPVLARASEPAIEPPAEIDATLRNMPAIDVNKTEQNPAVDVNATLRGTTPARAQPRPATAPAVTELDEDLGLGPFSQPTRAQTQPDPPRTRTGQRGSAPSAIRTSLPQPPPPGDLDGPTSLDSAIQVNATIRTSIPPELGTSDSMNQIIALELDDTPSARVRRDTDIVLLGVDVEPTSDGVPGLVGAADTPRPRGSGESVQPLPPPPATSRPSTATPAAGSLLPPRPPTRPPARPAITPPQVMSRPLVDPARGREDSDAIEVYAPAPPSAEAPPGAASERPGQYSHVKRVSQKMPALEPPGRERSAGIPIPPGLGRPGNKGTGGTPAVKPPPTPPTRDARISSQPIPTPVRGEQSSGAQPRPRTPTPGRTGPVGRTGSNNAPSSGVVMTRPAVIVGAPAKSAQPSRVRKAREDEGRGFGQGLISEKSLDEVILAYLSEDADDK